MELLNKEEFDKLTPAEKRVAICNDVIARMYEGLIQPIHGTFWYKADSHIISPKMKPVEYFPTPQVCVNEGQCHLCAKGALFSSWVGNFNKVEWEQIGYHMEEVSAMRQVVPELVEIFGQKMLDCIEAAFEGRSYGWHYNPDTSLEYANAFSGKGLMYIMEYIVAHGGEFPLPE